MNVIWFAPTLFGQSAPSTTNSAESAKTASKAEAGLGQLVERFQLAQQDADQWPDFIEFVAIEFAGPIIINLLIAGAIFLVGRWVARSITSIVSKLAKRAKVDETLITFLANIVYSVLMIIVAMAALDRLGVPTTSFAAVLAAAGFAIGMALQGSLGNFASGVMLIVFKPFKAGDFVEAGGTSGVVEEIHIFNTLMRTGDNRQIIVPNGSITNDTITNFSAKPTRRIDLVISCGYDDDLRAVKQYLLATLEADERVLADPEPVVAVSELGDNGVNLFVRPWVKTEDYWKTRWDLFEAIKLGFDERGYNIPYPTRSIHVVNDAA